MTTVFINDGIMRKLEDQKIAIRKALELLGKRLEKPEDDDSIALAVAALKEVDTE